MPWALKPRMFTWEANAKSPTFLATCGAENQIGCVLRPGKWPRPWKASGRSTGALEANLPPCVCSGHSAIGGAAAKTEILILVLVLGSTAMAAGVMVGGH